MKYAAWDVGIGHAAFECGDVFIILATGATLLVHATELISSSTSWSACQKKR